MTDTFRNRPSLALRRRRPIALRLAESAAAGAFADTADVVRWFAEYGKRAYTRTERVPLEELKDWKQDPGTGDISHHSGKFFSIEGVEVHVPGAPVAHWSQPIINQPEVGILGILAKEFDGVLHFLMQAKVEPGNVGGLQLSPTVQATRSNYTRVHGGRPVPYLEYFLDTEDHHIVADVRQSEQGSAFLRKRNRNMVVETADDVHVRDGFRWLTLGQLHRLLALDDLLNMDARTVLACLPLAHPELPSVHGRPDEGFRDALLRSAGAPSGTLHTLGELLSWITQARSRTDVRTARVPLAGLPGWQHRDGRISHESGRFFDVVGVSVEAGGREVARWSQPMIAPYGTGVAAFLVRRFRGVLHILAHTRVEAGYLDVIELAPTVQCTPANYELLPPEARPRFLDTVLGAPRESIRYDTVLSEEGGRFHHARNRYLIVETDAEVRPDDPEFRWCSLHQLVELLRHSHYLNVQARSLVACLHSLLSGPAARP
ncbi:NDP-hexose 2,3-dehydratase [Streptomyces nigrescens]|uniref:NDP-hexose 2,3-dehydratase n=2 Tax=Streptomyces TaxID=1883 RepID=A0ABM7ZY09_STRNI|nr:NDP-hexose 2,3-dehydratase family protein [Streptomyces nigrescens]MEE4421640.1 NDP-hexose 2,3-dehydratase family protein [Streptomyces sp. DSM 41528]BDM71245.1 NDP-hexose 2,3-dehydratase [Streptomyces nigrescens]